VARCWPTSRSPACAPARTPALPAGATAALVWSGQLAGLAVVDGLGWPVSLWLGVIVLAAFTAAALSLLSVSGTPTPQRG